MQMMLRYIFIFYLPLPFSYFYENKAVNFQSFKLNL